MENNVDLEIIRRYTGGKYFFRDLKKLSCWFKEDEYDDELKKAVESDWDAFRLENDSQYKDLTSVFFNLKQYISVEKKSYSMSRRILSVYSKIAVVLLIPLLIYSSYTLFNYVRSIQSSPHWVEIDSPYGARTSFELPDGTKVSLNSGARLKYDVKFKENRDIELDGEAYFDVHHDASSPFIVHTDVLDIKVLGTKFSVSSLSDENLVDVVLVQGKVQLTGNKDSFSEILKPNERFCYSKREHSGKIEEIDAKYLTAWKDGLLMFRNKPLGDVLKQIGRWYNVQIEVLDPEINDFRYRATFKDEPLEEVLNLISLTAPIQYKIRERTQIKNDLYESKTIEIRMKK